ncbi:craniofacial development protein 2-like [Patiria miniata]|uniref:Endonuclease/exonuclease/phosphatase domain-containing protein n=1 Tax=Patiria miniata TaxID=46514 RepID=A0A914A6C2_PATMI|nr:craniofacial development protein 2-like [Patiria miniata]
MDIVTLQETRLSSSGTLREKDFTFFCQGKPPEETKIHGVGFAVRNRLLGSIVPPTEGSERILKLQLHTAAGMAPTLASSAEAKDNFYEDLSSAVTEVPQQEPVFVLGDFNARVGADHSSWPSCLGQFGVGKMNENGQRLLELCCHHNLCITNTFFDTKPQHKVSWIHPRSKHWHQLDLVLTRRGGLGSVKLTRSFQSADCDTDHSLVGCKVKLQPQRFHRAKREGRPRIDTSKTRNPDKVEEFVKALENVLPGPPSNNTNVRWSHLRDTIYNAAMSIFGKRQNKSADWFEANAEEMLPLIKEKRQALSAYKNLPSAGNLQALRTARSRVQQSARHCANDYWLQLCSSIQTAANVGNVRGMYEGIKQAIGPTQNKSALLKSATGEVIKDRDQQMNRWMEHYSELYSRENLVSTEALDAVQRLPTMDNLDQEPTMEEVEKALDALSSGKAPGGDGIPPEVLKCGKGTLIKELHELLCQCWTEGSVPQDMRDANIITLYKK